MRPFTSLPPSVVSALRAAYDHREILIGLTWDVRDATQLLLICSGLDFSAIPDIPDGAWSCYFWPDATEEVRLRQKYNVTDGATLDKDSALPLLCELRDITVAIEKVDAAAQADVTSFMLLIYRDDHLPSWFPVFGYRGSFDEDTA